MSKDDAFAFYIFVEIFFNNEILTILFALKTIAREANGLFSCVRACQYHGVCCRRRCAPNLASKPSKCRQRDMKTLPVRMCKLPERV